MSTSQIASQQPTEFLAVPPVIEQALAQGAALAISLSGGKDSQALLTLLAPWFRERGYGGQLFAIHADLGRAEWGQTPAFVQQLADAAEVPLVVVRRAKGDLVARIGERMQATTGTSKAPYWPDAKNRYCTSHLKSGPIDQALRNPAPYWPSSGQRFCTSDLKRGPIDAQLRQFEIIISAEGVRADESRTRAQKPAAELRAAITASALRGLPMEEAIVQRQAGQRVAFNWRPLLHFTTPQVWQACGTSETSLKARQRLHQLGATISALSGWVGHPAYVLGNQRLSCALCVLGSKNDLVNGANHNPDTYGLYLELEVLGGATFKHGQSLFDLPVSGRAAELRDAIAAKRGEVAV